MPNYYRYDLCFQLLAQQEAGAYTDVILKAEGTVFKCHKAVLCASSSFFKVMFSHPCKETISAEVELPGLTADMLRVLIRHMYTGEVDINPDNALSLILAAEQYGLSHLSQSCVHFMTSQLHPTNCIGINRMAQECALEELAEDSHLYMMSNFDEVTKQEEFLELTKDELIAYLSDPLLEVADEDPVFKAMLTWISAHPSTRLASLGEILQCVNLNLCTPELLNSALLHEPLLIDSQYRDLLIKAVQEQKEESTHQETLVVLGGDQQEGQSTQCWSLEEGNSVLPWQAVFELPQTIRWYTACLTSAGVVVSGGCDDGSEQTCCWIFDLAERRWRNLPPMHDPRWHHASACHGKYVYIVGGWRNTCIPITERLDLEALEWSCMAPIQVPLVNPIAVVCGRQLFVLGGLAPGLSHSCMTQVYNFGRDEWDFRADMPESCPWGAGVSFGGTVYVVGGSTRSCMRYHPSTDTWTMLARLQVEHPTAPALIWKGRIIVGGGSDTKTVEEYDPETDEWCTWETSMVEEMRFHRMLSIQLH